MSNSKKILTYVYIFYFFYFKFIHRSDTLYINIYIYICLYIYIYIVTDCWYNDSIQRSVSLNSIAQRKEICSKKGKRGTCYFHFLFFSLNIFSRPIISNNKMQYGEYYSPSAKTVFVHDVIYLQSLVDTIEFLVII